MPQRPLVLTLLVAVPLLATADTPELNIPSFEHLRSKATETVDVTLGAWPLRLAALFMDHDDAEDAQVRKALNGVKSLRIVSYQFDSDFEYPQAEVEAVRAQLEREGWSHVVRVRNRDERSAVDISVVLDGERAKGLALVVSEPREFTIINLVGSMDLDTLDKLEGHLGVPHLATVSSARQTQ
jgi:hypothetical protein